MSILATLGLVGLVVVMMRKQNPTRIIIDELTEAGYSERMARMWVAVSRHETGDFTSPLFRNANNMFGMMQPKIRATTSIGTYRASEGDFARFRNLSDSAKDLVLYLRARQYPRDFETVDKLVEFMKSKGYFQDNIDRYKNGVKRFYVNT